jgi:purine-binding chemotaxis protein CheW
MEDIQVVVFGLNNEVCGVDSQQVHKIERYREVTAVPGMPGFMAGVINLRGKVVPVVDLNRRFEVGTTDITKKTKIIVIDTDGKLTGFVVNDVHGILKLSDNDMEVTPELIQKAGNNYLRCVGKKEGKLISILDLGIVLNVVESNAVAESLKE